MRMYEPALKDPEEPEEREPLEKVTLYMAAFGYNRIILTWEKNERETGYKIYRKQGDQEYSLLKNIESGDTLRYADTGLMFDTLYEYKICAVEKLDGEELLGEESDSVAQRTTLGKCENEFCGQPGLSDLAGELKPGDWCRWV